MILVAMLMLSGQAAVPAKANDDQRVQCHVEDVTGSLASHRRVCHTVAEWRALNDAAYDTARQLQDRGAIAPTNGTPSPGGGPG